MNARSVTITSLTAIAIACHQPKVSGPPPVASYRTIVYRDSAVFEFPVTPADTSASSANSLTVLWDTPSLQLGYFAEGISFVPKEILTYSRKGQPTVTLTIAGGYYVASMPVGDGHAMTAEPALTQTINDSTTTLVLRSSVTLKRLLEFHPDTVRMDVTPPNRDGYVSRLIAVEYRVGRSR
jgi:hypothetical protein